jgi:excisionase family DNA binding protein
VEALVTAKVVAEQWLMSEGEIRKLARERRIPAIRIGACWRFSPSALEQWFKEQQSEPQEE